MPCSVARDGRPLGVFHVAAHRRGGLRDVVDLKQPAADENREGCALAGRPFRELDARRSARRLLGRDRLEGTGLGEIENAHPRRRVDGIRHRSAAHDIARVTLEKKVTAVDRLGSIRDVDDVEARHVVGDQRRRADDGDVLGLAGRFLASREAPEPPGSRRPGCRGRGSRRRQRSSSRRCGCPRFSPGKAVGAERLRRRRIRDVDEPQRLAADDVGASTVDLDEICRPVNLADLGKRLPLREKPGRRDRDHHRARQHDTAALCSIH